jgi:hypothetical protein
VDVKTGAALVLAFVSTTLTNIAYLKEHDAVGNLPALSMRRPLQSVRLLLGNRPWLIAFATESVGFILYAVALALAPLSLVQSVAAGGIGLLAFFSARMGHRKLARHELAGVLLSVVGLAALAVSLTGGQQSEGNGQLGRILLWLGATAGAAIILILAAQAPWGRAVSYGLAGGLFFSIGDIATKVTTQGGARTAFVVVLIAGYTLGTSLLQIGYQAGAALTVAGLATLVTNALPIAAGTVILDEPLPSGALGALRVLAFAAVVSGAVLLAKPPQTGSRHG